MIRNPDGTPYQLNYGIEQYNPNAPEHALFAEWDEEAIRRGGSPIYYYEMFIQPQTVDPIYLEDRGKLFSPNPIELYCTYEPRRSQNIAGQFGIDDVGAEMIFQFNYKALLKAVGHPLKDGSRLYTPHLGENWVIIQRNIAEFTMWGVLRFEAICQKFQESLTAQDGNVTKKKPVDYKII